MKNESEFHMAYMSLAKQIQNNDHEIYPKTFLCHTTQPLIPNLGVGQYLAKVAPRCRNLALSRKMEVLGKGVVLVCTSELGLQTHWLQCHSDYPTQDRNLNPNSE